MEICLEVASVECKSSLLRSRFLGCHATLHPKENGESPRNANGMLTAFLHQTNVFSGTAPASPCSRVTFDEGFDPRFGTISLFTQFFPPTYYF